MHGRVSSRSISTQVSPTMDGWVWMRALTVTYDQDAIDQRTHLALQEDPGCLSFAAMLVTLGDRAIGYGADPTFLGSSPRSSVTMPKQ